jgi:N6-adenosine-specific RNA methylase IME4
MQTAALLEIAREIAANSGDFDLAGALDLQGQYGDGVMLQRSHPDRRPLAAHAWTNGPFVGLRHRFYGAIAVDPPSHFSSYTAIQSQNWSSRRDNERHYATMSFEQLAALPVSELASPEGCHLFLWTSGPFLPQALELIKVWKFRFSSRAFTWIKTKRSWDPRDPLTESDFHVGLGLTVRHQTEIVLLARRGNCRRQRKDVRELIIAPRREHSRKPAEFYSRVERYCAGPYVDLFAREQRPGWDAWGDEVDKFGDAP